MDNLIAFALHFIDFTADRVNHYITAHSPISAEQHKKRHEKNNDFLHAAHGEVSVSVSVSVSAGIFSKRGAPVVSFEAGDRR